jgi:hypothetical protein
MRPLFPLPVPGIPRSPLPIGERVPLPRNSLIQHLDDRSDPHGTRALVPALRFGTGAPSVEEGDKATDFYFDTEGAALYVMKETGGVRQWVLAATGSGSGGTPAAAEALATEIAAMSHDAPSMSEDEKDALLKKIADYVAAKESML